MKNLFNIFKRKESSEDLSPEDQIQNEEDQFVSDIPEEMILAVKTKMEEILKIMQFDLSVEARTTREGKILLLLEGTEDMGRIIGKEGATLYALQKLLNAMMAKGYERKVQVVVDANEYRRRREKALAQIALNAARMVLQENTEVILDPMNSEERRMIHLKLESHPEVHTYSKGQGRMRQIVIAPGKKPENPIQ